MHEMSKAELAKALHDMEGDLEYAKQKIIRLELLLGRCIVSVSDETFLDAGINPRTLTPEVIKEVVKILRRATTDAVEYTLSAGRSKRTPIPYAVSGFLSNKKAILIGDTINTMHASGEVVQIISRDRVKILTPFGSLIEVGTSAIFTVQESELPTDDFVEGEVVDLLAEITE